MASGYMSNLFGVKHMEYPIIRKGTVYFSREVSYCGQPPFFRFSPHAYDAKRFKTLKRARNKASMIGGTVVWFDPIHGSVRE